MKELPERSQLGTEEKQQIKAFAADGWSVYRIAKAVNRSPHTVKAFLSKPEVVTDVQNEKSELAVIYQAKARKVVESITDADISKASLQQKSISSGVLLDKSLLLAGGLPTFNVQILLQVAEVLRIEDRRDDPPALPEAQE